MLHIQSLKWKYPVLLFVLLLPLSLTACTQSTLLPSIAALDNPLTSTAEAEVVKAETVPANDDENARPAGWGEESHSNKVDPNYEVVFPTDKVNQITFRIDPDDWEAMQANMTELFGEAGTGPRGPGEMGEFARPEGGQPLMDRQPPAGFQPPQGGFPFGDRAGGPGGMVDMTPENPMWIPATVEFEGKTWTNVGVRYKGNSSLRSTWSSGSSKLPFKLDFDEFEDDYPEIKNQRFYGFKQLSFANNFSDASYLRESVTSDLLEEAGLPAAKTAFYEIILDYGEGPVSLGLYTLVEVIDDTAVKRVFGSDDGNIYEADGVAASLAAATFDQISESFQKENNKNSEDWSDIEALFNALHSDLRTSDPEQWRTDLEAIFDVESFLRWLALSAVIQHWDTYGAMSHNYYLYNEPETRRIAWISWDHNMSMMAGMGGARGGPSRATSLDKAEINENWPLIRYLLDEPIYSDLYVRYVEETANGIFNPDKMAEHYNALAEMIGPYVTAEIGESAFETAVQQLIDHAYARAKAVELFLDSQ